MDAEDGADGSDRSAQQLPGGYVRSLPEIALDHADEIQMPNDNWRDSVEELKEEHEAPVLPGPLYRELLNLSQGAGDYHSRRTLLDDLEDAGAVETVGRNREYMVVLDTQEMANELSMRSEWALWELLFDAMNGEGGAIFRET